MLWLLLAGLSRLTGKLDGTEPSASPHVAAVTSPNDRRDSGPIVKTDARTVSIGFAAYLYSIQMQIE